MGIPAESSAPGPRSVEYGFAGPQSAKIIGLHALPSTAKFIRDVTKYHLYFDESSAMTYAVSASEIHAASAAETRARRQQTRRLNFASPAPSPLAPKRKLKAKARPWDGMCTLGILGAIGYALTIAAVFSTGDTTGLFSCRTVAPEWVCVATSAIPTSTAPTFAHHYLRSRRSRFKWGFHHPRTARRPTRVRRGRINRPTSRRLRLPTPRPHLRQHRSLRNHRLAGTSYRLPSPRHLKADSPTRASLLPPSRS